MDPWNGRKLTVVYSTPLPCHQSFSPWCLGKLWTPMTSSHCGMSFLKHSRKTCRAGDLFPFQPHVGICQSTVTCLECFPVFWQITRFAALVPLGLAGLVSCLKAVFFFFFFLGAGLHFLCGLLQCIAVGLWEVINALLGEPQVEFVTLVNA